MHRPRQSSNYSKNRSSFVSVNRHSIYNQSRNQFNKAPGNSGSPDEVAIGEENNDRIKETSAISHPFDAVSASGFHHPGAKVISPTGDVSKPCCAGDATDKRMKGFTTADELAKGQNELIGDDM